MVARTAVVVAQTEVASTEFEDQLIVVAEMVLERTGVADIGFGDRLTAVGTQAVVACIGSVCQCTVVGDIELLVVGIAFVVARIVFGQLVEHIGSEGLVAAGIGFGAVLVERTEFGFVLVGRTEFVADLVGRIGFVAALVARTEFVAVLVAQTEVVADLVAQTGSVADRIELDHTGSEVDRTALGSTVLGKVAPLLVVDRTVADSESFDFVYSDYLGPVRLALYHHILVAVEAVEQSLVAAAAVGRQLVVLQIGVEQRVGTE